MKTIEEKLLSSSYSIFFFRKINPRWIIFSLDTLICIFSIFLAFLLRFNFSITPEIGQKLYQVMALIIVIRVSSFLIARVSASIVRYTSLSDVFRVLAINSAGTAFLLILNIFAAFLNLEYPVPFSIIGIDFFATAFLMIIYRLGIKLLYVEFSHGSVPKTRVVIYGSKEMAVLAKRALELDPKNHYKAVAFISTSSITTGKQLEGISIFPMEDLEKVIHKYNVDQLLFASSKLNPKIEESVVQICLNNNVQVFNIPDAKKAGSMAV